MEMVTSSGNNHTSYGVEAGYSEEYGSDNVPKLHPTHQDIAYSTTNVDQQLMTQPLSTTPVNPFTQQEYEEKVTNPFVKKS